MAPVSKADSVRRCDGLSAPDIAEDVRTLLEYYRALGIERVPVALNPGGDRDLLLKSLHEDAGGCSQCRLSGHRRQIVSGEGGPEALIMFVGEAPGKEEDLKGLPFAGDAGSLLLKLIEKMGLERKDVYLTNIVKCRTPMDREPEDDEIMACRPILDRQIEMISPHVIMAMGPTAVRSLMGKAGMKMTSVRGHFFDYKGVPVMPTFSPSYLLLNPKDKWLTWTDAQHVLEKLSREKK